TVPVALRQSVGSGAGGPDAPSGGGDRHQLRVCPAPASVSRGWKVMKRSACAAALFLASTTIPSLADDSNKQMKTDRQTQEASEKAEKKAKEGREKEGKKAGEPWGIAFGAALLSEYNFRGISGSDHRPAVSTYFEPHYDFSRSLQAYVNVTTNSITFPTF